MIEETTMLRLEPDIPRVEIDGDRFLLSIPSLALAQKFSACGFLPDMRSFLCYDFKDGNFICRKLYGERVFHSQSNCEYRPMLVPLMRNRDEVDEGFGRDNPDGTIMSGGYIRFMATNPGAVPICYGNRDKNPGCIAPSINPNTLSFVPCMEKGDILADEGMEPLKWVVFDGVLICRNYLITKFGFLRDAELIPISNDGKKKKGKVKNGKTT